MIRNLIQFIAVGLVAGQQFPDLLADEPAPTELAKKIVEIVDRDEELLLGIFTHLHTNPELGFQEVKTAAIVAQEFKKLGYEVHTGIGKTGVVGILKNGPGPVVMYRGDMDGLPVLEATALSYASKVTAVTDSGATVPVMHACGHDSHVTFLIGVAKIMMELKKEWSGTLVLVAQPAEEPILGARAMVRDGLYDKVPKPDFLISPHVSPIHPAGSAAVRAGRRMAGTDQLDVIIYGVSAHGSTPQLSKDPIVMGAMAVMGYQTIVSRRIDPQEPCVITVGSFQAGQVNNIIPDSATLKVNLRWYNPKVRTQLIDGVKLITDSIATASEMPADKMPKYIMKGTAGPVVNDEELVQRAEPALRLVLGQNQVRPGVPPIMGSEDFPDLASPHPETKILFVEIGCGPEDVDQKMKLGIRPPVNHSPAFQVELPAIPAGTKANAMIVLELLRKR